MTKVIMEENHHKYISLVNGNMTIGTTNHYYLYTFLINMVMRIVTK